MWSSKRSFIYALALAFVLAPSLVRSQTTYNFTPNYYYLKIDASDLATSDTFSGAVLMNMTVSSAISSLKLHSQNLTINESSIIIMKKALFSIKWEVENISRVILDQNWLNVFFRAPLALGEYSIHVEFMGYYQSSMAGFAKVGYHFRNEQKYLAVTALEPANARRVFPCYDVPGYRTKFRLEITVNRPHMAISSVKPTSVQNISDSTKRVFLFNNYPQMPVYQLGWAVLDQTSYTLREDNSTSTVIHTRAPYLYINQTMWANQLTARLVDTVGNYTGMSFNETDMLSSSKIEQVVLPEFFIETSEGYGFMSFSEEKIIISPNKSSTRYIQDVGLTLTRGVVQQWFGDLVSMNSWENIWLMKGLDQFLQYVIAGSMSEMAEWELADQAVVDLTQPALALDSPDSHPLTVKTDNEAELITSVFDSLTKYKGGAIIRMLKDVFGSSFDTAMKMFISTSFHTPQYNPSTPTNFWNMLYGVASDQNIDLAQQSLTEVMQQWTNAPGYPVLSVTSNTSHFNISQSNSSQWWVPITYILQGSANVNRGWLQPGSSFTVQAPSSKWILLNVNQTGFYRVNYSAELWRALSTQLSADLTQLPRLSRAQLIDDAFTMDPVAALQFTGFLRAETDYFPWNTALRHFQKIIFSMDGHSSYQLLQNYVLDLMNGVIAEVGLSSKPQDTHIDKLKRSFVLEKACQFGHQTCILKAVSNLRSWMAQTFYDPDLSPALLCAGVANSTTEVWHNVWSMYQYSVFPGVRLALLKSLTCTYNADLLYQFMNNITSTRDPEVSLKDKTILLQTLASKPFGAHTLLNWLIDRLKAQVNSSSETFTPATNNTSPEPVISAPNVSTTPRTDTTENQTSTTPGAVVPTVKPLELPELPESDVITILNLIQPLLTTLEDGTKLDSFLTLGNQTGLSNTTLELMKRVTKRIYIQADQAMKLNAKLTTWLEAEAAQATTTGESTKLSTQTPRPQTTPAPGSAPRLASGAAFFTCLLAIYLHVSMMV